MSGLWRNDAATPEGKYLVMRRDGSVPEWPSIVLGAKDPAAPAALRAYADCASTLGYDPKFIDDIRALATEFDEYRALHGHGDPCAPRHRIDNPDIVSAMQAGKSA